MWWLKLLWNFKKRVTLWKGIHEDICLLTILDGKDENRHFEQRTYFVGKFNSLSFKVVKNPISSRAFACAIYYYTLAMLVRDGVKWELELAWNVGWEMGLIHRGWDLSWQQNNNFSACRWVWDCNPSMWN